MLPDFACIDTLIREVAASEILPRFRKLAAADMHEKVPGQLVTIADTEAEKRLTIALEAALPGSVVVGEEGVSADPARLDAITGDRPVWFVDPVDGTQNFADGSPVFATMVALRIGGQSVASWIYDPVGDRMASAVQGAGAWLNGKRLHVATARPIDEMTGRMPSLVAKTLGTRVGSTFHLHCAGHEYIRLASGSGHFALFYGLYPWDHAPGELLFREAGGFIARLDGSPYMPEDKETGLLAAPDTASWDAVHALLHEHFPQMPPKKVRQG